MKTRSQFAFAALAVALCAPPQKASAIISIAYEVGVRLDGNALTLAGTLNGDYDPDIVTPVTPNMTRYGVVCWFVDDEHPEATIPITGITYAHSTLRNSGTASSLDLNYSALTFFPEGSGAPVVGLYDESRVSLTSQVNGQQVVGTTYPQGTKYVVFADQRFSQTIGGGQYAPNSDGESQFLDWTFVFTRENGSYLTSGIRGSVMLQSVPEPGSVSMLGIAAIGMLRIRKRRL